MEKQSFETLPQNIKDDINAVIESCPEPITGVLFIAFTENGSGSTLSGKVKRVALTRKLQSLLLQEIEKGLLQEELKK
jgi:hypothetical protein